MVSLNLDQKQVKLIIVVGLIIIAIFMLEEPELVLPEGVEEGQLEIINIHNWINSEPLTLKELRGKVILIDFWTYSCINCIRTLPYITAWDEKYRDQGLVIIGVHSPEFEFEKDYDNVLAQVIKHNIQYPVALDNDFSTWRLFQNRYWPHKYLIDKNGTVRYDHIGEGGYEETERQIQLLLKEINDDVSTDIVTPEAQDVEFGKINTPEIYFGMRRGNVGNRPESSTGEVNYVLPETMEANIPYLEGIWISEDQYIQLVSNTGKIHLTYIAKSVNIVAGSDIPALLSIELDGAMPAGAQGESMVNNSIVVSESKLYNLVNSEDYGTHNLTINAEKGVKFYTFTFG